MGLLGFSIKGYRVLVFVIVGLGYTVVVVF